MQQIQNWLLKSIFTSKTLRSDRKDRWIDLIAFNMNHKITLNAEVSENHANIVVNQALENSTDSFGVNAFIEGNVRNARMDIEAININQFSTRDIYENRASIQPFSLMLHYS